MDSFRAFLIEGLNISAAPGLEEYIPQAKTALTTYLKRYGSDLELNAAKPRYKYMLIKRNEDKWAAESTFYFKYDVADKGKGHPEIADKSDWRYEHDKDWDGVTGKKAYKSPKDAIREIPANATFAYRGMSWEEWRSIQKTGVIQSAGSHNFNNQGGLTFYGPKPDTGENYAGSFAPAAFKPTPTRPGVVIAVPRHLLKTSKQNPGIPQGELAHEGPLDAKNIAGAWLLVVTSIKPGSFDLIVDGNGKVREGSRFSIGLGYAIRQIKGY